MAAVMSLMHAGRVAAKMVLAMCKIANPFLHLTFLSKQFLQNVLKNRAC